MQDSTGMIDGGFDVLLSVERYCQACGKRQIAMRVDDWETLRDVFGVALVDVRRPIVGKRSMTFEAGGGYNVIDADLLGGTGDGRRELELRRRGVRFEFVGESGRASMCGECERWR